VRRATPLALAVAAAVAACTASDPEPAPAGSSAPATTAPARLDPGPACIPPRPTGGRQAGACLPLAPADRRVDLTAPAFSDPAAVTNPLHPSARTEQVIYGGQVDGGTFRTEFTRLPEPKRITWNGRTLDAVTMQYLAFQDGRVAEVALDWFAQADDGAVWYLGEDVFNYEDGVVADTEGTWVAGPRTPGAMIMPARPRPGDVYRPENAPGLVFEEVQVKAVDHTVPGPSGPVAGAVVVRELHADGSLEDKVFAPGYGEFSTGSPQGDLEAVSLAMPTDRRPGPAPASLAALTAAVAGARAAANGGGLPPAAQVDAVRRAWAAHRATGVPPLLDRQTGRDVAALADAVRERSAADARDALLRVAQDELDLRLAYGDVATVDRARAALWAGQARMDAAAGDTAGVLGDVAAFEWTWQRVRHRVPDADRAGVEAAARTVRAAAGRDDPRAAARTSAALAAALAAVLARTPT
jgi:hypothetical protein